MWAFITDLIDHTEVKTGERNDATVYGLISFIRKLGQALGGALTGYALTFIGYDSLASVQTESVKEGIYALSTLFPGVCYIIAALLMIFVYPLTKKVVDYAHERGVTVEGELGTLAGIEDEVVVEAGKESYTKPEEVIEFVERTGVDSLAIAIGTSHGAYKFTPEQCTVNEEGVLVPPPLRFDILEEVSKKLPGFPIVLHGSSSVPQEYVKMVNENGGKMPNAIGVPESQLREAAKLSVFKINIDSDLRLAMTGTIRKFYNEHPDKFDPREYLKPARANIKEIVRHKLKNVLGCAGKADECK